MTKKRLTDSQFRALMALVVNNGTLVKEGTYSIRFPRMHVDPRVVSALKEKDLIWCVTDEEGQTVWAVTEEGQEAYKEEM